jgi:MFS family permease
VARPAERSLLRNRDFVLLWTGQTVSEVGSSVTQLALPLLAVITLDATTFEVGALAACTQLAFLLIALPAGAWVDRWRRRPVLIWADIGRLVVIGSIPIADALGVLYLPQLFVVAIVSGALTVFIDALSFLFSAVMTIAIRSEEPRPEPRAAERRLRDEIREGLAFVFGHPILRKVVGCTATSNFFSGATFAVMTVFLVRTLDSPTWVIGVVFSIGSLGGLIGGLLAGRIGKAVGTARIIWLSQVVVGPFALCVVLAFPGWGLSLVALSIFAVSIGGVIYNVAQVSYRQSICPPALLGRMNASVRFVVWGTLPLGALFGGIMGSVVGVRETLLIGALGGWAAALWVVFSPLLHMRDLPTLEDEMGRTDLFATHS